MDVCDRIQVLDQGRVPRRARRPTSGGTSTSPPPTSASPPSRIVPLPAMPSRSLACDDGACLVLGRPDTFGFRAPCVLAWLAPRLRGTRQLTGKGATGERAAAVPPVLELERLTVGTAASPRSRAEHRGQARRDRRTDRPERGGEVDDAPRDHGSRAGRGRRRAPLRPVRPRSRTGGDCPLGRCPRSRGAQDLRRADRGGEPPARPLRASRPGGGEEAIEEVYGLFPVVREFGRRQAGALSGGQQQQLAIGRALVAGPDLLLLDEPSLGLAPRIVDVVFDALAEIPPPWDHRAARRAARAADGCFADRTYLIADGRCA